MGYRMRIEERKEEVKERIRRMESEDMRGWYEEESGRSGRDNKRNEKKRFGVIFLKIKRRGWGCFER